MLKLTKINVKSAKTIKHFKYRKFTIRLKWSI